MPWREALCPTREFRIIKFLAIKFNTRAERPMCIDATLWQVGRASGITFDHVFAEHRT